MPNAKPFPLYTDGANIYYTTDGVNFNTLGSGGSGTITTAAPLSGDGSVGTPATIAAGAIALTKLATEAATTVLANATGGTASPTAVAVDSTVGFTGSGFGVSGWWANAQRLLVTAAPALTEFVSWKAGVVEVGAPAALVTGNGVDASGEGGSVKVGGSQVVSFSSVNVWQTPGVLSFGLVCRAKFLAVSANLQQVSITSSSHGIVIAAVTSKSATNWVLRVIGTGETSVTLSAADTNWHDFAITFDGTTIICWVDGVNVGSTTTLTNLANEPMLPQIFSAVAGLQVSKALWGYVAP